ncbi:B12-binding domain-containing radical SAM protein [Desulfogranum japonicum]|uniref:B12-binding domain-containing radical SAM protein n=1 Tax=Desulfogranum japonicum TaxID=231447 RepID=UPI00048B0F78
MLLIHPPVAKPGEAPAGISQLAGALRGHGIDCLLLDANLEALQFLLDSSTPNDDTWSVRAAKNRYRNLTALKTPKTYCNVDRYQKTVRDVNRVIEQSSDSALINLSNYQEKSLSPLRSADLLQAATCYTASPYYSYYKQRVAALIAEYRCTHIGISLTYLSQALCSFALIGFLKHIHPQLTIIVGGGLITSWMSSPDWSNPFSEIIDHLVAGPGEGPLLNLLGKEYRQRYAPDFSNLPMQEYLSPCTILPYAASTGCYWNKCSFCPEKAEGSSYSTLQPELIQAELDQLCLNWQPGLIHFLDNAVSPTLMRHLIDRPPGPHWYGFARMDKQLADSNFCNALRRSGCVLLKLGLESGNQQVLDNMKKGITLGLASRVFRALHQAGICTYVYLLFGAPQESPSHAVDTLNFCADHAEAITFLNLAIFNLPRYSPESSQCVTRDFYQGDLSLYSDFIHPLGWNRKAIRKFLDKDFKRHPAMTSIIQRDPPFFSSNHAPFFCMDEECETRK